MRSSKAGETVSTDNQPTLYLGCFQHAIDQSNRIMLPSEWRGETPARFFLLVHPADDHLVVCPPQVFETFLDDLRDETADKTQIPKLERELNERVRQVSTDSVGRLPLPLDFLAKAGIKKQGVLIARFSKFEIWPPDKYQAAQSEQKQAAAPLLNKLQYL